MSIEKTCSWHELDVLHMVSLGPPANRDHIMHTTSMQHSDTFTH